MVGYSRYITGARGQGTAVSGFDFCSIVVAVRLWYVTTEEVTKKLHQTVR